MSDSDEGETVDQKLKFVVVGDGAAGKVLVAIITRLMYCSL